MSPRYRLRIARAEFRFAAAHFTLFEDREAETLHGHNYRVAVEVEGPALRADGLLVEIAGLKRAVRELCARWDDRVLLPARSTEVSVREKNGHIEVTYRDREYRFPTREVVLLDLVNTTIELLARQIWEDLRPVLANSRVDRLTVAVEEIEGQAGSYEAPLRTV
jgi:6-pyruvoyltetrahydropterin/6-carboxytetrahydropterin synthase